MDGPFGAAGAPLRVGIHRPAPDHPHPATSQARWARPGRPARPAGYPPPKVQAVSIRPPHIASQPNRKTSHRPCATKPRISAPHRPSPARRDRPHHLLHSTRHVVRRPLRQVSYWTGACRSAARSAPLGSASSCSQIEGEQTSSRCLTVEPAADHVVVIRGVAVAAPLVIEQAGDPLTGEGQGDGRRPLREGRDGHQGARALPPRAPVVWEPRPHPERPPPRHEPRDRQRAPSG